MGFWSVTLLTTALTSCLLFSGITYGWAPMVLLLKDEGQFSELCPDGGDCEERDQKLNLIYTCSSSMFSIVALPSGMMLDTFGAHVVVAISGICQVLGTVLIAFSDSKTFDYFIPAFSLTAFGGGMNLVATFHAAFVFPNHRDKVLACLNCFFDASTIVFMVLYEIYEMGVSRKVIFLAFSVLAAVNYFLLATAFAVHRKDLLGHNAPPEEEESDEEEGGEAARRKAAADASAQGRGGPAGAAAIAEEETTGEVPMQLRSLRQQVCTGEMLFVLMFLMIMLFRVNFYLGTNHLLLEDLGDAKHNFLMTKVFGYIVPLGFLYIPLVSYLLDNLGVISTMQVVSLFGIVYGLLELVPSLYLQVVTAFIYTGFRALLFSSVVSFNAQVFGVRTMGRIQGTCFVAAAFFCMAQSPVLAFVNQYLGGNFKYLNIFLLVVSLPFIAIAEALRARVDPKPELDSRSAGGSAHGGSIHGSQHGAQQAQQAGGEGGSLSEPLLPPEQQSIVGEIPFSGGLDEPYLHVGTPMSPSSVVVGSATSMLVGSLSQGSFSESPYVLGKLNWRQHGRRRGSHHHLQNAAGHAGGGGVAGGSRNNSYSPLPDADAGSREGSRHNGGDFAPSTAPAGGGSIRPGGLSHQRVSGDSEGDVSSGGHTPEDGQSFGDMRSSRQMRMSTGSSAGAVHDPNWDNTSS